MRSKDQMLLENLYSDKIILSEKLIGNLGWVYHRTWNNPENSDISKKGIQPSRNASSMYGKGLYCCYDLEQQFKENMRSYGFFILKGKIDLSNFVILEKDVFENARPKENFENYLDKLGIRFKNWQENLPYTSDIANSVWRRAKQNGYNGIIFTGRNDGKVAVIWNRNNFIPYQYAFDQTKQSDEKPISSEIIPPNKLEWKNLNPNIKNIKRPHDPEYDQDIEKEKEKKYDFDWFQTTDAKSNLHIRPDYINSNKLYQPNLKTAKIIYVTNGIESVYLPNLEEVDSLFIDGAKRCILPKLKKCKDSIIIKDSNIVDLKSLEEAKSVSIENTENVNLPKLKSVESYLMFDGAKNISCPSLVTFGSLHALNANKIVLGNIYEAEYKDERGHPVSIGGLHVSLRKANQILAPRANVLYANANGTQTPKPMLESYNFKKFFLKESLIQIPLEQAYEIFKNEYEKSTGKSWDRNKFMGRASNWEFYGDDKGYVAIRRQRSGFVKLVGMAGDMRSKLKGMQDLLSMNLPLWGMVSKEIKDLAVRKGMRMPNILERQVLKRSIPPEVFGDAKILDYTSDGGIKIQYPDIGVVIKYLIGTPLYYSELRNKFGDKIKNYFNEK